MERATISALGRQLVAGAGARPRSAASIALALAAGALVAGCGGKGGDTSPTASPTATPSATTAASDGADTGGAVAGGGAASTSGDSGTQRLVVVGDSLAEGRFADTQAETFPTLVASSLGARLQSFAIAGATTAQLTGRSIPDGGTVAVVEAGTNDFLEQTARSTFKKDYRALLERVTGASPHAKLVCLTLWIPKDAVGQKPTQIPASFYDTTIRHACSAGTVVDISPLYDKSSLRGPQGHSTFLGPADDFHPNTSGHAAIARLIEARVRDS